MSRRGQRSGAETGKAPAIGWGLVGASSFAASYVLPAIRAAGGRPLSVFSSSASRGRRFARENQLDRATDTLDELLADHEITAVYVSTTNDLHASQTIAAARAGKHVLCEKPLATRLEDAVAMRDTCHDSGVVLGTNHHLRGAATITAIRRLIEQGVIGGVLAARVSHARSLPAALRTWRVNDPSAGAGVILDITTHDADTLRFVLDDEITAVTAVATSQGVAREGIEDSVMGVMEMRSGVLASFHDGWTVAHAGTGLEVHGTDGSLIGRDLLMPEPVGDVQLRRGDSIETVDVGRRGGLYEHAIERFHAAVAGTGRPLTSGEDGIASLAVALAVRESAATASRVEIAGVVPAST